MVDKSKLQMGVEVNVSAADVEKKIQSASSIPGALKVDESTPFHIAVLGDFSGRGAFSGAFSGELSGETSGAVVKPRFIEIDRDNFEQCMADFNIQLMINLNDDRVPLQIKELDDFHPDTLYENLESFSKLRSLRRRLKNNKTFADAATEIQGWLPEGVPVTTDESADESINESAVAARHDAADTRSETPVAENLLDSILDSHNGSQSTDVTHIDRLIRSIVAPYVEPAADPRQDEMIEMVDKATATHMRDILHSAEFQSLEATWQSLWFLLKRVETGSRLKIKILDISKQALQKELAVDDITSSCIYKLFCDQSEGEVPWSVLLGSYSFTDTIEDVLMLASMGSVAQQAGAPFIAAAEETWAGCDSFAQSPDYDDWNRQMKSGVQSAWQMLRESPVAHYLGLALPGFLLRLPYGKKSRPIESFSFEEMPDEHCHDCYLWGNAAFLKVECLARNFNHNGWLLQPETVYQTENLPVHYYKDAGETQAKPVAEILLTEKGGEIFSQQGLIPVWSVRDADIIRSSDYRSLAIDGKTLRGRWHI